FLLFSVMKDCDGTTSKKSCRGVASRKRKWSFSELRKAEEKNHTTSHAANEVNFSSIKVLNLQHLQSENAPVNSSPSEEARSTRHTMSLDDVTSSTPHEQMSTSL
ncbi:hypothetical protein PMAYCL1PPCAC_21466, partial [Pristionchus mayeri]